MDLKDRAWILLVMRVEGKSNHEYYTLIYHMILGLYEAFFNKFFHIIYFMDTVDHGHH